MRQKNADYKKYADYGTINTKIIGQTSAYAPNLGLVGNAF